MQLASNTCVCVCHIKKNSHQKSQLYTIKKWKQDGVAEAISMGPLNRNACNDAIGPKAMNSEQRTCGYGSCILLALAAPCIFAGLMVAWAHAGCFIHQNHKMQHAVCIVFICYVPKYFNMNQQRNIKFASMYVMNPACTAESQECMMRITKNTVVIHSISHEHKENASKLVERTGFMKIGEN